MKLRQISYRKERNERLNPHNLRHTTQRIIRVINKRILKVTKELKVYLWEKCRVVGPKTKEGKKKKKKFNK